MRTGCLLGGDFGPSVLLWMLWLLAVLASGRPGAAAEEPAPASETRMVIVEGLGKDVEEARRDAYRMAVRQVLGSLVDAKTLVENDQLITDKVVVFSNGYVDNVEPVPDGEVRESKGLVRIKFKAFVKAGKLDESLRANGISPSESKVVVDNPQGQLAQVVSEQERKRNAREMFLAMAEGYPANCFTAAVGQPKILGVVDRIATCEVRVKISVKQKEYDEFVKRLVAFLESGPVEMQGDFHLNPGVRIDDCSGELLNARPKKNWRSAGVDIGRQYLHEYNDTGSLTGQKMADFVRLTGKRNTIWISAYAGSDETFACRWFGIDHTAVSYPTVLPEAMQCSVLLCDAGGARIGTDITLHNFGYSRQGWECFYFMPGYRSEKHNKNPFGPTFEFIALVSVPEAVFNRPGLTIEASLTNVPVAYEKPSAVPAETAKP